MERKKSILNLRVEEIVSVRNRYSYVVTFRGKKIRVPMFDHQIGHKRPAFIQCRVVGYNDFGYPTLEQVPISKEVQLIEPVVKPKTDKPSKIEAPQPSENKADNTPTNHSVTVNVTTDYHNLTYYRWNNQESRFEHWFISTGGVRRRYLILLGIAEKLADHHRKNMVYKELVPDSINIRISKRDGTPQVQMPKTEYISSGYENIFIFASHSAPEVVNKRMPNTPMSDCYSFAIIVYELLSFCHPFIGDIVTESNSSVKLDDAYRGRLPWIDDHADKTNGKLRRLYDRMFVTNELYNLLCRTFEEGREDMWSRPTIFEWIEALKKGIASMKYCTHCKTDYIYEDDGCCAICDEEPVFNLKISIAHIDEARYSSPDSNNPDEMVLLPDITEQYYVNKDNEVVINTSQLMLPSKSEKDMISIKMHSEDRDSVTITPCNDFSFVAATPQLKKYASVINKVMTLPMSKQRMLVLAAQDLSIPQRVITIQMI